MFIYIIIYRENSMHATDADLIILSILSIGTQVGI